MARTKGAASDKWWAEAVRIAVNRESDEPDADGKKRKRLSAIADKLARMAEEGDMQAIKEIGDRLDGRPAQAHEVTGEEGGPIQTISKILLVDGDGED